MNVSTLLLIGYVHTRTTTSSLRHKPSANICTPSVHAYSAEDSCRVAETKALLSVFWLLGQLLVNTQYLLQVPITLGSDRDPRWRAIQNFLYRSYQCVKVANRDE